MCKLEIDKKAPNLGTIFCSQLFRNEYIFFSEIKFAFYLDATRIHFKSFFNLVRNCSKANLKKIHFFSILCKCFLSLKNCKKSFFHHSRYVKNLHKILNSLHLLPGALNYSNFQRICIFWKFLPLIFLSYEQISRQKSINLKVISSSITAFSIKLLSRLVLFVPDNTMIAVLEWC